MRYKRREFRDVEAYQFTQEMMDDKSQWPEGITEEKSWDRKDEKPKMLPAILHNKNSVSFLAVNCWVAKCLETGEIMVYYDNEEKYPGMGFDRDFVKVPE